MSTFARNPDSLGMKALSIVLIGRQDKRREALAKALEGPQASVYRLFEEYPAFDTLSKIIEQHCNVVIIDLDEDPERALDLIENICGNHSALTVIVYSSRNDAELMVRCMRAGVREVLTDPILPNTLAEALVRAAARRVEVTRHKKVSGKILVFVGAKGGSGVTTLSSNFALALTKESESRVVLVDLDLELGDAALTLGITGKFTVLDALRNTSRLDSDFISTLLTDHSSGLSVLPAPSEYISNASLTDGAGTLLRILREDFSYVVVDAGSNPGQARDLLFELADAIYLVTEVNIPGLRNSRSLITHLTNLGGDRNLEVVLNRFDARSLEIDETSINKALTQPAKWKIPNDYAGVRRAQNTGVPIAMENTAVSQAIYELARAACGKIPPAPRKKRFGLFG